MRWLWVRLTLGGMKYLICSFARFGNKAKRGVEFRHATRNAWNVKWRMEAS